MRKLMVLLGISMLALAGCSSHDATVILTPSAVPDCGKSSPGSVVEIHWDASEHHHKAKVKVWVSNQPVPTHAGIFHTSFGTLFASGGPVGTGSTGPWVWPGMTITVTSGHNVLAQVKVPGKPCPKK